MSSNAALTAHLRLNSSQFDGGLNRALRESNSFVSKISTQFGSLKNVLTGGALGIGALFSASAAIEKAAEFEKMRRMLALVSGGANAARLEFEELRKVSLQPGMDLESAVQATVRLRALGYTSEESRKHLETLAKKVSAFGGSGDEMKGVILALSQIASKGKISAEEINQLAERLPSIRKDMKEAFGTANTEELQKMNLSAREFIDTLLNRWSSAPGVTSGITEEMKRLRMELDGLKAAAGTVVAPLVSGLASGLARIKAMHAGMVRDLDKSFWPIWNHGEGNMEHQSEMADWAGGMDRKWNDVGAAKEAKEQIRQEKERAREALRNRRNQVIDATKGGADTDERKLDLVNEQISQMTDLKEIIEGTEKAYATGVDITAIQVSLYQDAVRLLTEQANLVDRINSKKRKDIEDAVKKEMMTPQQRRKAMRDEHDEERARKKVFRREENKRLKEEEEKARKNVINDIKKGEFPDKDKMRRNVREQLGKDWTDIFKENNKYLNSIDQVLKTLAAA